MEFKFKHFIILQILDILTTYLGMTYLHLREANIVANQAFSVYGLMETMIVMKIVGLIVMIGAIKTYDLICLHAQIKINLLKIKIAILNISCIIFIIVVLNNLYQMINVI